MPCRRRSPGCVTADCGLRRVERDDHTAILRLLADRHHDLTGLRTQAACRLHVMFRELTAGSAPLRISAAQARQRLDDTQPGELVHNERRRIANGPLPDTDRIDREINAVKQRIADAVIASGTPLTE